MPAVTDRNDPNFDVNAPGALPGRWRCFELTVLGMGNEGAFRSHSYISLEAGLSVIRRRLSAAGRDLPFRAVFDFVRQTFSYGDALAEYWEDCHDDRNALLHPDNDFSPYVIQPMSADDILELFDPMLSLYRYLLIGDLRPTKFR